MWWGRHLAGTALAVLGLLLCPQLVSAGEAEDDMARGLFQAGRAAFQHERYAEAKDLFARAYALSPRPQLLFNIGEAADRLRQDAVALAHFERYLEALPYASNADAVQARIEVLRRKVEVVSRAPGEPVPAQPAADVHVAEPEPTPTAARDRTWPLVLVGTGAALFTAGIVTGVVALGSQSELDELCPNQGCEPTDVPRASALADDIDTYSTVTDALWLLGTVATGAGLAVWFYTGPESDEHASVGCSVGYCGGAVRW